MERFKGIALLTVSGVLLIAALVLVLMNLGNQAQTHLYVETYSYSTGLTLLIAAAAGALIWAIVRRAIPTGVRTLSAANKHKRQRDTERRLKELEREKKAAASGAAASAASETPRDQRDQHG